MRTPFFEAPPRAAVTVTGVAITKAHGHAITRSVMARSSHIEKLPSKKKSRYSHDKERDDGYAGSVVLGKAVHEFFGLAL